MAGIPAIDAAIARAHEHARRDRRDSQKPPYRLPRIARAERDGLRDDEGVWRSLRECAARFGVAIPGERALARQT